MKYCIDYDVVILDAVSVGIDTEGNAVVKPGLILKTARDILLGRGLGLLTGGGTIGVRAPSIGISADGASVHGGGISAGDGTKVSKTVKREIVELPGE
ncbi:hypothetical protein KSF78_0005490 [Schistosoma japonicum]|nr:hypothetical protein KSF78_0005490 [Schistosoma japonicum]